MNNRITKWYSVILGILVLAACPKVNEEPDEPKVEVGNWKKATNSAAWGPLHSSSVVVFTDPEDEKEKIWILGGAARAGSNNKVFHSEDGINWKEISSTGKKWPPLYWFAASAFQNKIWVMGGTTLNNNVWSSTNGKDWTGPFVATWSKRNLHSSTVFQAQGDSSPSMWVLGGSGGPKTNDVWKSSNGKDWVELNSASKWSARSHFDTVIFKNNLWVLGGQIGSDSYSNEVWKTANGRTWTQVKTSSIWPTRYTHQAVVYKDKIWVMGGYVKDDSSTGPRNDVWSSADGEKWEQVKTKDIWPALQYFSAVVFKDKIWVIGGLSQFRGTADVWYYEE